MAKKCISESSDLFWLEKKVETKPITAQRVILTENVLWKWVWKPFSLFWVTSNHFTKVSHYILKCFLNEKIPEEVQWFTVDQEGVETEIQTSDGVTNVKAEDPAITYRCKIDENTYADFKVRSSPSSHPPVTTITGLW